jgi:hypothetical protein
MYLFLRFKCSQWTLNTANRKHDMSYDPQNGVAKIVFPWVRGAFLPPCGRLVDVKGWRYCTSVVRRREVNPLNIRPLLESFWSASYVRDYMNWECGLVSRSGLPPVSWDHARFNAVVASARNLAAVSAHFSSYLVSAGCLYTNCSWLTPFNNTV